MNVDGYSSDELKCFHRVLQAAMGEATARRLDVPVSAMIARLFAAAERGERDPVNLKTAILMGGNTRPASNASSRPSSITVMSEKHTKRRPVLTLFPRKPSPMKRPRPE